MHIPDGYTDVPDGKIAAVVTLLEMTAPPDPRLVEDLADGEELRLMPQPDLAWYRDLFRRVGEEWLWFSRLRRTDEELVSILHDPQVEVYALWRDGRAEGLIELDFAEAGVCEIQFFGLTRVMIGRGAGRRAMGRALARAWSQPIERVKLKTCTHDHPRALAFYLKCGFRAYGRQIEVADDPRLVGLASPGAGPHVPVIPANSGNGHESGA